MRNSFGLAICCSGSRLISRAARAPRAALLRGIYLIVNDEPSPLRLARAALEAGVRIVQYRAKRGVDAQTAGALRSLTRRYGALLMMNDDVEAAVAFDCDGVHLGPADRGFTDISQVRETVGDRLIGLSCGSVAEARAAAADGADYAGAGSVYRTASKADAGRPIGIDGLREIAAATALPVAAIGGIDARNLRAVRDTGVAMAAVISAVAGASDPHAVARALVEAWA
jgi:thiamine-phosphate pyrophosphorylase